MVSMYKRGAWEWVYRGSKGMEEVGINAREAAQTKAFCRAENGLRISGS